MPLSCATEYYHLLYLLNFLFGFSVQCSQIFVPLVAKQVGGSDLQVGLVVSLYGSAFLISSLLSGWLSDSNGRLLFVRIGLLAACMAFGGQLVASSLSLLMITRAIAGVAVGVATPALIAYAYESGTDVGKFSSYACLGWIAGAGAAAFLKTFTCCSFASCLSCLLAFCISLVPKEIFSRKSPIVANVWLTLGRNYHVYLGVFLRYVGAYAVWAILPVYFVSLGLDELWIGLLWGLNFATQFVVMPQLHRFRSRDLFLVGQLLSICTFVGLAYAKGRFGLMGVQVLGGVGGSCLYVGALLAVLETGEEHGTASGVFQSTLNLCGSLGPLLGGAVSALWG
ncbi:MAG: MFS transporter, partial [Bacillota bacterium]